MKKMMVFLMTILTASVFAQGLPIVTIKEFTNWFRINHFNGDISRFVDWEKKVVCYKIGSTQSCLNIENTKSIDNRVPTDEYLIINKFSITNNYRLDDNQSGVSCYYGYTSYSPDSLSCVITNK